MKIIAALAAFLLSGCLVHTIEYTPQPITDKDPREIVQQVILEQLPKTAPTSFLMQDNYFQVGTFYDTKKGPKKNQTPVIITVYFNNIGNIKLTQHGNYHVVYIYDRAATLKYKVFTRQAHQAELFIDALHTLAANSPTL